MLSKLILAAAAATLLTAGEASAAEYETVNHADLVFAEHDGTKLVGDLFCPRAAARRRSWSPFTAAAGKSATSNSIVIGACSWRAAATRCSQSIIGSASRTFIRRPSTT